MDEFYVVRASQTPSRFDARSVIGSMQKGAHFTICIHIFHMYLVPVKHRYTVEPTPRWPRIHGTQVKSSMRMKKHMIHLNDYFWAI